MLRFKPNTLGVRCILKPIGIEKKSAGGIDLSAISGRSQAVNTDKGTVFMLGENAWFDEPTKPDIQVGDLVYYAKYGAKVLQDPNDKDEYFVLLNDKDILCAYEEVEETV